MRNSPPRSLSATAIRRQSAAIRPQSAAARSQSGAAIAEFAPALFLILIIGLLPVIDVIVIGIDYTSIRYLNELQLREAQKLPKSVSTSPTGPVMQDIPNSWKSGPLGLCVSTDSAIQTNVSYEAVPWNPVGGTTANFYFVDVSTTVPFRPFLKVPFFNAVPGLGANVSFTVSSRRPMENNRFLNE